MISEKDMPLEANNRISVIFERYGKDRAANFASSWPVDAQARRFTYLGYADKEKKPYFTRGFIAHTEAYFSTEESKVKFPDLFTDGYRKFISHRLSFRGRSSSKPKRMDATTMPEAAEDRLTVLMDQYSELAQGFEDFVMGVQWTKKISKVQKSMYVRALLYGRYDQSVKKFPEMLKKLVKAHFDIAKFEDIYTEKRKEFLSRKPVKLSWMKPDIGRIHKIGGLVAGLKADGIETRIEKDAVIFEAPNLEPITMDASGEYKYVPRIPETASQDC